jgi:hypothetical protein
LWRLVDLSDEEIRGYQRGGLGDEARAGLRGIFVLLRLLDHLAVEALHLESECLDELVRSGNCLIKHRVVRD